LVLNNLVNSKQRLLHPNLLPKERTKLSYARTVIVFSGDSEKQIFQGLHL